MEGIETLTHTHTHTDIHTYIHAYTPSTTEVDETEGVSVETDADCDMGDSTEKSLLKSPRVAAAWRSFQENGVLATLVVRSASTNETSLRFESSKGFVEARGRIGRGGSVGGGGEEKMGFAATSRASPASSVIWKWTLLTLFGEGIGSC